MSTKASSHHRAVIFTALPVEYQAVKTHLSNLKEEKHAKGTIYERGTFFDNGTTWEIGIAQVDKGNANAATEVERAINHFKPEIVLFVGIAGGVKDVKKGDVIAANKAYGYESGKCAEDFKPRPDIGQSSYEMIQRAKLEAKKDDWLKNAIGTPSVYIGPVASGEKVLTSTNSEIVKFLKTNYNDTLAVDMESYGFLKAMHSHNDLQYLVIRGVSDLIDSKTETDEKGFQEIAAKNASAFAFEVISKTITKKNSGKYSKLELREIIDELAEEISKGKRRGPKPTKAVISFRNEDRDGKVRDVLYIPLELLKFRKNNGRIASEIYSYEKKHGELIEASDEAQKVIRDFLRKKDPEKTEELQNSIIHGSQKEPAIITSDGFLINGNRRKLVFEQLAEKFPGEDKYKTLKVVMLPGKNEPGGPPKIIEIEEIENRYQLQSDGKAEYTKFDRALSIRRKIELGMTLEEQLHDDPNYATLADKDLKAKKREYEKEYLGPLSCIDKYLETLGREGLYETISGGGRWEAFIDYYKVIHKKINDPKKRKELKINKEEAAEIENIAFKIIRQKDFPNLPKTHEIIRELSKWLEYEPSKKEIMKLKKVNLNSNTADKNRGAKEEDLNWSKYNQTEIIRQVKTAKKLFDQKAEKETPLTLLNAALKKLNHDDMKPPAVKIEDISNAMKLASKVKNRANDIESEFYHLQKSLKKKIKDFNQ